MSFNNSRRHLSQDQQLVLVEFLERHPDLLCNRKKNGKMLWHVLAKKLNVVSGGVRRPSRLWAKTWFDKKSSIKKLLLKQSMELKTGVAISHVKWTPLDMRIIKMLREVGELKTDEIEVEIIENAVKGIITKTEKSDNDQDSLPSHASSPTLPDGELDSSNERFANIEYLESNGAANAFAKRIYNQRRDSDADPLQAEWSRVASMEEKRIQIEQKSSKARQDTSEAMHRCALAIEALAGAVNYQGAVISDALRGQGEAIAEALKAQGKMIAEALEKR